MNAPTCTRHRPLGAVALEVVVLDVVAVGVVALGVVDAWLVPDAVGAEDVDAAVVERDVVEPADVVDDGAGEKDSAGDGVGGRSSMVVDGAGPVTAWMAY
ncbi:MAG TPA: hypothetical protein VIK98_10760 [Limnochordales bacterium]